MNKVHVAPGWTTCFNTVHLSGQVIGAAMAACLIVGRQTHNRASNGPFFPVTTRFHQNGSAFSPKIKKPSYRHYL
ncbi:hypothetical protein ACQ2HG_07285 [Aeromonas hydrophila]|uniref:hypothetical protein n=1 Tax=Aeromonas hydrophila TaxID=644 RepID=UPI001C5A87D5|nr:hypothetical protein [Aeromonas hydrophila]MBW3831662.1 hypothetical protein [Aeromonas hydrophila]MBW5264850.1 hypothetical protein [Aeromonas hydrophila]MBW5276784.1 hypothetical protein [Aeromonas hydrophila]UUT61051.1 hypothetical protein MOO40_06275 [Aeromonas hydrophila]